MPREGKKPPSSEALALLYLRSRQGWSQKELAARMGLADYKQISRYETSEKPLSRKRLNDFAAALGYPPEAVEAVLFIDSWIEPEDPEEPHPPEPLPPAVRRSIDRSSLTLAWTFLDGWRMELSRAVRNEKVKMARRKAQELWGRLKSANRQERRETVAVLPEFQDWALAELVCEASIRAAAHKPEDALDLADLALFIAKRVAGNEGWRSRLEAYCWAHVGNARRVANDFVGADRAFAQVWVLWRAGGANGAPDLLAEWLLCAMEASLRRAQHRFPEALELLERARNSPRSNEGLILLQKEHVFDQMGNTQEALMALLEAAPFIEVSGDTRLLFALRFKTANHLCYLGRFREASERLPQVRELALQQGNELYLVRVVWLEARITANEGRREEAMAGLEQVRQAFTARGLPYDAALASLELATLYLEEERTVEVRNLARSMGWIFQAQGIAREALAALTLFFDAAQRESATVELTRRIAAELERMRVSAPQKECQRGRG